MKDISMISPDKVNTKKFLIPYVLLVLLALGVMLFHSQTAKIQDSDSIRINLAGRQRMLTQKLSKEVLQYSRGIIRKEEIELTIEAFDTTIYALLNGGSAPLDLDFRESVLLPQMENSSTSRQLSEVVDLWQTFRANVLSYMKSKDASALYYILHNNEKMLDEMDEAVFMMQKSAEKNHRTINIILNTTCLFIILIFAGLSAVKLYLLKHASVYIDRLESILPICANCKKIREPDSSPREQESWTVIESYIGSRSKSTFSHGLCPACEEELYGGEEWFEEIQNESDEARQNDA